MPSPAEYERSSASMEEADERRDNAVRAEVPAVAWSVARFTGGLHRLSNKV
jgi:hypothetical protein